LAAKTQPQATHKQTQARFINSSKEHSDIRRVGGKEGERRREVRTAASHLDKLNVLKNGSIFRSSNSSSQDVDVAARCPCKDNCVALLLLPEVGV